MNQKRVARKKKRPTTKNSELLIRQLIKLSPIFPPLARYLHPLQKYVSLAPPKPERVEKAREFLPESSFLSSSSAASLTDVRAVAEKKSLSAVSRPIFSRPADRSAVIIFISRMRCSRRVWPNEGKKLLVKKKSVWRGFGLRPTGGLKKAEKSSGSILPPILLPDGRNNGDLRKVGRGNKIG